MDNENGYSLPLMQSKIDVQNQIITLMQTEIDMQSEKISKQATEIKNLTTAVEDLRSQVLELISMKSATDTPSEAKPLTDGPHEINHLTMPETDSSGSSAHMDDSDACTAASVAEMARQTAEETLASSGFVYHEESGLYYDYSTGYYYDANSKLYYNGHTRTYYSYDERRKKYNFHSQLPIASDNEVHEEETGVGITEKKKKRKGKHRSSQTIEKRMGQEKTNGELRDRLKSMTVHPGNDIEEGELSSCSSDSENSIRIIERSISDSETSHTTVEIGSDSEDEATTDANSNPPCIRIVVQESNSTIPKLKKGFLFIVTCMGGTIGREGSHHVILLPDPNVSKDHAEITYDFDPNGMEEDNTNTKTRLKAKKYFISDLGSQNGTFLNGKRLSPSNVKSDRVEMVHGSILQILDTRLLVHIHSGQKTCGHCEPGLLLEKEVVILNGPILNQAQKEANRKKFLQKIRQKYAIAPSQANTIPKLMEKYKDRATERRRLLGSDHHAFKLLEAEPASIHVPLAETNKGFKMLKKMGWSAGNSLGQTGEGGVREPVKFEVKHGRGGLGTGANEFMSTTSDSPPPSHYSSKGRKKKAVYLQKTAKRYFAMDKGSSSVSIAANSTNPRLSGVNFKSSLTKSDNVSDVIEID